MRSEWLEQARAGSPRAIGRLITRVENSEADARTIVTALYRDTGRSHIIGITGPPGSGKSTLVTEVARELRRREVTVGIIAVDPSSPFTGGALLGDRVRMRDLSGDRGVFIRSMASRGSLGGLARATSAAVKVLDAAGFDAVLIETVGAGQAEVDIAMAAHTTIVVEAPGMGDDVQSIKAGILEIADVLVVNKADRPGAQRAVKSLEMMLHLGPIGGTRHHGRIVETPVIPDAADDGLWQVPVLETVAVDGQGVAELVDTLTRHRDHLRKSGEWQKREQARSQAEIEQLLQRRFMEQFRTAVDAADRRQLIADVARRRLDAYSAVDQIFARFMA